MRTRAVLDLLRKYESPNVTFMAMDGSWPIVWTRAKGSRVWDAEGREYLDLTGAFGVAAAGHANARVVGAARQQMATLLHAMGDVHPHALKARLARELSRVTFERWTGGSRAGRPAACRTSKTVFCNSGFEAVEAALKTAMLATGKRGVIAFEGAYHGLGYGALNATHRPHFRAPFLSQLGEFAQFVPYPQTEDQLREVRSRASSLLREAAYGAVLVEPVQGRAGVRVPPSGLLPTLREMCNASGALLVVDEVFTGFGRTGRWFACEHSGTIPDVLCLGKAMTGGFPLSACVGRADVMDRAWPKSTGEAIHTSTFLGHPVGCAMALAQMREIRRLNLVMNSARLGRMLIRLLDELSAPSSLRLCARGCGLMAGLEVRFESGAPATDVVLATVTSLLHRGFIFLPEGDHSEVIGFTPPLTITGRQLTRSVRALQKALFECAPR